MEYKTINWCGYEWISCMEGNRLIHPDCPNYWYDPDGITVNDNIIEFHISENPREIKHWDGKTYYPFYGAPVIRSINAFNYGTFSCECKLPKGKYLWPAFWLSGYESWPPEIDIFEGYTENKGNYKSFFKWTIETNVHYKNELGESVNISPKKICRLICNNPLDFWNTFECVWRPDIIELYVNDYLVRTVKDKNILNSFKGNTLNVIFDFWLASSLHQYGTRLEKLPEQNFIIRNFRYTQYNGNI